MLTSLNTFKKSLIFLVSMQVLATGLYAPSEVTKNQVDAFVQILNNEVTRHAGLTIDTSFNAQQAAEVYYQVAHSLLQGEMLYNACRNANAQQLTLTNNHIITAAIPLINYMLSVGLLP